MNTMKKSVIAANLAFCLSTSGLAATLPSFKGDVTFTQNASRLVEIGYTLADTNAVVTVDILTNGVSIGEANFCNNMYGEVNRLVRPGAHKIYWRPDLDWPGHKFVNGEVTAKVRAWPVDDPPPYMILSLHNPSVPEYRTSAEGVPGSVTNELYMTTKMVFKRIYATGRNWQLGILNSAIEDAAKSVPFTAAFTEDYYLAIFPMTAKQYMTLGYSDPYASVRTRTDLTDNPDYSPVSGISYEVLRGATSGHDWPNDGHTVDMTGSLLGKIRTWTGVDVDLPTEAQWEMACRAGTLTATYLGDDMPPYGIDEGGTGYRFTAPSFIRVGHAVANSWGLYDMLGYRHEWTLNWYADRTEDDGSVKTDPNGPLTGSTRTVVGGAWQWGKIHSASRLGYFTPALGIYGFETVIFRLAAPAVAK